MNRFFSAASTIHGYRSGPVVAAAVDQANALALQAEAIAVVFDFMKPDRVIKDDGHAGRQAKIEGAEHCWNGIAGDRQIDVVAKNCESRKSPSRVRFRADRISGQHRLMTEPDPLPTSLDDLIKTPVKLRLADPAREHVDFVSCRRFARSASAR
jgi:hypothetical protein